MSKPTQAPRGPGRPTLSGEPPDASAPRGSGRSRAARLNVHVAPVEKERFLRLCRRHKLSPSDAVRRLVSAASKAGHIP